MYSTMTTLITFGAPIGLWLHAIREAEERLNADPIVKESPQPSPPPSPPARPVPLIEVLVAWDPELLKC